MKLSPIAALALGFAGPLSAQTSQMVLRIGDPAPGAGSITDIERVLVNFGGYWMTQVRTDDPVAHTVVLAPWGVGVATGDAPLSLGGGVVIGLRAATCDQTLMFSSWIADVSGAPFAQAVMFINGVQMKSGSPDTANWSEFPGTLWRRFDELQTAPTNFGYLVRGTVDDVLGGQLDQSFAAVAWPVGGMGPPSKVDVIARESELAPGLTRTIELVRPEPGRARLDFNGERVLWSCDLDGSTLDDGCVYLTKDGPVPTNQLLAREGSPSPVPGRTWGPLEDISTFVSGKGKWSLRAQLDAADPANDEVLVLDGAVFAREGEVHPATAPWPIESLGGGPAWIDELGGVLWFARWDDPTTPGADEGLFYGDLALARTGQTQVGGLLLTDIESGPDSAALALDDGTIALFVGSLSDGTRGLVRSDRSVVQSYCTSKKNSSGCVPRLLWGGWPPSASSNKSFTLSSKDLLPNQPCILFYGKQGPAAVPFGGGLLCVEPPLWRLAAMNSGGPGTCSGATSFNFNAWIASGVDPDLTPGQRVYVQLWQRDPGFAPPDDVGMTNAVRFVIGP